MTDRELIARIDGATLEAGRGSMLVYRLGSHVEIAVAEEKDGDAAVLLTEEQALGLARELIAALSSGSR